MKRNKYKEVVARMLYDHDGINQKMLTMQKSCKEADEALLAIEKKLLSMKPGKGKKVKKNTVK